MVRMKDIAEKVGVSYSTVSFVLNGRHKKDLKISPAVVKKVEDAARELHYRPNGLAKAMITKKTKVISFVSSHTRSKEYSARTISGMIEEVQKQKYFMHHTYFKNECSREELINSILEPRPEGVICYSIPEDFTSELQTVLNTHDIPFAVIGSSVGKNWDLHICQDDVQGTFDAMKHLYELGHVKIGIVCYELSSGFAKIRNDGYLNAAQKLGIKINKENLIYGKPMDIEERIFKMLSMQSNRPTAVVCSSDMFAMLVIRAALRANLKLPEDLSIVGFGNLEMSEYATPPLTTIQESLVEMGRCVIKEMLKIIENGRHESVEIKLPDQLIVRASTMRPKIKRKR